MKRVWAAALLLLLLVCPALAEETITACGITVAADATAIDFGDVRVTDVAELVRMLDAMPQLETVDMYRSRLDKADMDMLFNRYPQITFGWTFKVGDHEVRTDITAFSTLHGTCPDPSHNEKQFQWLKFCKGLKAIDVGHNSVTDISWLTNFPELKVLIIAINRVEDITPLAQLTELEYIELFTNRFSDLTPLKGLTKLRDLNIKNTKVRDITPLMEMPWLERLWLGTGYMKNVPEEQVRMLSEALPDCEIDWKNSPTDGTWREHPHYFTIYEMFHGTEYIPFDQ